MTRTAVGPGWTHIERQVREAARQHGVHLNEVCEQYGASEAKTSGCVGTPSFTSFREAMRALQQESLNVCEWCGAPGELRDWDYFESLGKNVSWIKTLCDTHALMWAEQQHWRSQHE